MCSKCFDQDCVSSMCRPGRKKGWAGKQATAPEKRAMRGTPRRFFNMANVRLQCRLLQFDILNLLCLFMDEEVDELGAV